MSKKKPKKKDKARKKGQKSTGGRKADAVQRYLDWRGRPLRKGEDIRELISLLSLSHPYLGLLRASTQPRPGVSCVAGLCHPVLCGSAERPGGSRAGAGCAAGEARELHSDLQVWCGRDGTVQKLA